MLNASASSHHKSDAGSEREYTEGDDAEKAKKKLAEQQKKLAEARKDYERVLAKMPGVTQPRWLTSLRHLQPEAPGRRSPSDTNRTPPLIAADDRPGRLARPKPVRVRVAKCLFGHPLLHHRTLQ